MMKKVIGILSVIVLLSFTATTGWKTFIGKYEFTQGLMVDTLKSNGTPPVTRGITALPLVDTNGKFSVLPNSTNGYVLTMVAGVPAWAASSGGSSYTFSNGLTNTSGTVTLGGNLTSDVSLTSSSAHSNVTFGSSNNYIGNFNITSNQNTNLQSGLVLGLYSTGSGNGTVASSGTYPIIELGDLTIGAGVSATLSMPASPIVGQTYIIYNLNTSGTATWSFGGATAVKDLAGNTITTMTNGKGYLVMYDGSSFRAILL